MKAMDGSLTWDLWLDFHTQDANGLTSALLEHARCPNDESMTDSLPVNTDQDTG